MCGAKLLSMIHANSIIYILLPSNKVHVNNIHSKQQPPQPLRTFFFRTENLLLFVIWIKRISQLRFQFKTITGFNDCHIFHREFG